MFSRYLAKGVRVENSADQPGFEEAVKKKKRRDQRPEPRHNQPFDARNMPMSQLGSLKSKMGLNGPNHPPVFQARRETRFDHLVQ
jgi:hypothetical protein